MRSKSPSVAVSGVERSKRELKTFRDLFSIAPMLKSSTATMLKRSRSYSRPNRSSSHLKVMLVSQALLALPLHMMAVEDAHDEDTRRYQVQTIKIRSKIGIGDEGKSRQDADLDIQSAHRRI
jgi:hypothetical protein